MEPLPHHMKLLSAMFNEIRDSAYEDDTDNNYEAQWYEPWGAIFNRLRLITDWRLTVFPQPRLIRLINRRYEGSNAETDCRSLEGHHGSDGPMESERPLHRATQIPDFALIFYDCRTVNFNDPNLNFNNPNVIVEFQRHIPLIIEIKPYNFRLNKNQVCNDMIKQTLVQARHTFELEGLQRQILHVMCIVGGSFFVYALERRSLDLLPMHKDEELEGPRNEFIQDIRDRVMESDLDLVQNDDETDYSDAFKDAWDEFVRDCGLGVLQPRW